MSNFLIRRQGFPEGTRVQASEIICESLIYSSLNGTHRAKARLVSLPQNLFPENKMNPSSPQLYASSLIFFSFYFVSIVTDEKGLETMLKFIEKIKEMFSQELETSLGLKSAL